MLIAEAVWCGKTLGVSTYEWRDGGLAQILLKAVSVCSISMLDLLS